MVQGHKFISLVEFALPFLAVDLLHSMAGVE